MRFFLSPLFLSLILAIAAPVAGAQSPGDYWRWHAYGNPYPNNYQPYPSMRPGQFVYGPYISPYGPSTAIGPFPGTMPYNQYRTFVGPTGTAPIFYYDPATNTYRYGSGYLPGAR